MYSLTEVRLVYHFFTFVYPVQHTPLLTVCTSVSVTNWSSAAGLQGSDELKSAAVNQLPVMDLNE